MYRDANAWTGRRVGHTFTQPRVLRLFKTGGGDSISTPQLFDGVNPSNYWVMDECYSIIVVSYGWVFIYWRVVYKTCSTTKKVHVMLCSILSFSDIQCSIPRCCLDWQYCWKFVLCCAHEVFISFIILGCKNISKIRHKLSVMKINRKRKQIYDVYSKLEGECWETGGDYI